MNLKARDRAKVLLATLRQFEDCQSIFLSPTDLQAFGVEAYQVDIADDGIPQFEPRFFDPYPVGVLQKYPINAAGNNYDVRRFPYMPTLQDALATVQESLPVSEDPLKAAQKLFEKRLKEYHFWDDHSHADFIANHIAYELSAVRDGGSPFLSLLDLGGSWETMYVNNRIPAL